MNRYKTSNKELSWFLGITFGLTIIMGIAMGLVYKKVSVEYFGVVQMLYPATGAIIVSLLNKEDGKELPGKFFKTYLFFALTSIVYLLISVFVLSKSPSGILDIWLIIGSIGLIFAYVYDNEKTIKDFGLKFKKNKKSSIMNIFLFIGLYLACIFISSIITGDVKGFIEPFKSFGTWFRILILPISFMFTFILFLGEEYGWRYFLQPALQERIGKRKGVIVLGLIWGIWHMPLNIFSYSPETPFHSIVNQLIICITYSVFFGYVYMKTKNIWAISFIHFLNNNIGFILYEGTPEDLVFTWEAVLFNLVIFSIVYLPFLLTKEYRKSEEIDKVID